MRIIGKATDSYDSEWIAIVTTNELRQANEKYYGAGSDEFTKTIKVGAEINLGDIPNQRERIAEAAKQLGNAQQALHKAMPNLQELALALARTQAPPELLEAAQAAALCISELSPTQARSEVLQMLTGAIEKFGGAA